MTYEYIVAFYEAEYNRWCDFGSIFNDFNAAGEECDYYQKRRPENIYRVLRREVSDWTWKY